MGAKTSWTPLAAPPRPASYRQRRRPTERLTVLGARMDLVRPQEVFHPVPGDGSDGFACELVMALLSHRFLASKLSTTAPLFLLHPSYQTDIIISITASHFESLYQIDASME